MRIIMDDFPNGPDEMYLETAMEVLWDWVEYYDGNGKHPNTIITPNFRRKFEKVFAFRGRELLGEPHGI